MSLMGAFGMSSYLSPIPGEPNVPSVQHLASEMSVYPYPIVTALQLATSVKLHLKYLGA